MLKHTRKRVLFASALSLAALGVATGKPARAAPVLPTLPTNPPVTTTPPVALPAPVKEKVPRLLNSVTLDYDKASQYSAEVLNAKVSVTFKDASFLSALDAVIDASDKTCRIECRQLHPLRLSMNVKDVPVASLLDSLAKLSGARLFVLPSKLILAPESALTEDEKKTAKPYGVLLTAATLPDTPDAKALSATNTHGKSILDIANAKVSHEIKNVSLHELLGGWGSPEISPFKLTIVGPLDGDDLANRNFLFNLQDVKFGDALASFAHIAGLELYLKPDAFLLCRPDKITSNFAPQETGNAVPAFAPSSTGFADPSAKAS